MNTTPWQLTDGADHNSTMCLAKEHACELGNTCSRADTCERHVKHRWETGCFEGNSESWRGRWRRDSARRGKWVEWAVERGSESFSTVLGVFRIPSVELSASQMLPISTSSSPTLPGLLKTSSRRGSGTPLAPPSRPRFCSTMMCCTLWDTFPPVTETIHSCSSLCGGNKPSSATMKHFPCLS